MPIQIAYTEMETQSPDPEIRRYNFLTISSSKNVTASRITNQKLHSPHDDGISVQYKKFHVMLIQTQVKWSK